jgi:hypothetical protein
MRRRLSEDEPVPLPSMLAPVQKTIDKTEGFDG